MIRAERIAKRIEKNLMALYDTVQEIFPDLDCITFSVTQSQSNIKPRIYGFLHVGDACRVFDNINHLNAKIRAGGYRNDINKQI